MDYEATHLKEQITINDIFSIHYFEYMSDFSFPGESHGFWEFLCVDKGEVGVTAGERTLVLKRGDIIFHKPDEFHSVTANGIIAPNLVVAAFACEDASMEFFENKVLTIGERERSLIAQIITEAKSCFSTALDNPYLERLERRTDAPFGAEQLIKLHLEQLLIQLYRGFSHNHQLQAQRENADESHIVYQDIIAYFEQNIRRPLTIGQICRDQLISSSLLKKLFRQRHKSGVIQYFTAMKIGHAKHLIRSHQMNFTQIADYLGYTSVHYFSRQFKKETGMTPSEYLASIKQRTEGAAIRRKEIDGKWYYFNADGTMADNTLPPFPR